MTNTSTTVVRVIDSNANLPGRNLYQEYPNPESVLDRLRQLFRQDEKNRIEEAILIEFVVDHYRRTQQSVAAALNMDDGVIRELYRTRKAFGDEMDKNISFRGHDIVRRSVKMLTKLGRNADLTPVVALRILKQAQTSGGVLNVNGKQV